MTCRRGSVCIGVDVSQTDHPASEVLGDAELPVGVATVDDVLGCQMADMTIYSPSTRS